jgi:glycosyltransferase involved in cell wall biosynthesis
MLNIVKTNNVPLLQPDSLPLDLVEGAASSMRIAVLVPCFNEEAAVALVVAGFRKALPSAEIFVYDNNSSDRTSTVAREAGAQVRCERRQGKGNVVRRMFADIEADIYVLVDGDATYYAASAPRMIDASAIGRFRDRDRVERACA